MIELGERKIISSCNVNFPKGSYALEKYPFKFEKCRERFACRFNMNTKGFFFNHEKDKGKNVMEFIAKTERILKVRKKSSFAETNYINILWFEPCHFWKSCWMRRSLLTILLRAGIIYDPDKDNFESALFSEKYVVKTKKSVMRFMYGFTKYQGPPMKRTGSGTLEFKGWKTIFYDLDVKKIKSYLVLPRKTHHKPKIEDNKLWT